MAKRYQQRPLDHDDPADEMRGLIARHVLKECLFKLDPRVPRQLTAWIAQDPGERFLLSYQRARQAGRHDEAEELLRDAQTVLSLEMRECLQPFTAPEWLGDSIALEGIFAALHAVYGHKYELRFQLSRAWEKRLQRRAKNNHATIPRDIEWFYRNQIKQPAESLNALARDHIERQQQAGIAISNAKMTVKDGIRRAKTFLA